VPGPDTIWGAFEAADKHFVALGVAGDLQPLRGFTCLLSHRQQSIDSNQPGPGGIGPCLRTDDTHAQPRATARSDADRQRLDVPRCERMIDQQLAEFRDQRARVPLSFAGKIPFTQQCSVAPQGNTPLMAGRFDAEGDHGCSPVSSSTTTGAYASSNISN